MAHNLVFSEVNVSYGQHPDTILDEIDLSVCARDYDGHTLYFANGCHQIHQFVYNTNTQTVDYTLIEFNSSSSNQAIHSSMKNARLVRLYYLYDNKLIGLIRYSSEGYWKPADNHSCLFDLNTCQVTYLTSQRLQTAQVLNLSSPITELRKNFGCVGYRDYLIVFGGHMAHVDHTRTVGNSATQPQTSLIEKQSIYTVLIDCENGTMKTDQRIDNWNKNNVQYQVRGDILDSIIIGEKKLIVAVGKEKIFLIHIHTEIADENKENENNYNYGTSVINKSTWFSCDCILFKNVFDFWWNVLLHPQFVLFYTSFYNDQQQQQLPLYYIAIPEITPGDNNGNYNIVTTMEPLLVQFHLAKNNNSRSIDIINNRKCLFYDGQSIITFGRKKTVGWVAPLKHQYTSSSSSTGINITHGENNDELKEDRNRSKTSSSTAHVADCLPKFNIDGANGILQNGVNQYVLYDKIGSGSTCMVYNIKRFKQFGKYQIYDNENTILTPMVLKLQTMKSGKNNKSSNEEIIYNKLSQNENKELENISCKMYDCFESKACKYYVFEKLGATLQHLLIKNGKRFDLNTVLTIIDQMIGILVKLHSIGFVHNDIKPENILIGNDTNTIDKLYLIDFGIATKFWDFQNNKHILNQEKEFSGTFHFSSINHHCEKMTTSRRDDLESLMYMCIFCLTGHLPWVIDYKCFRQSVAASVNNQFNINSKLNINGKIPRKHLARRVTKTNLRQNSQSLKQSISIEKICSGLPKQFQTALYYIRNLQFEQMPDYVYLHKLFLNLREKVMGTNIDWNIFDINVANQNFIHFLGCKVNVFSPAKKTNTKTKTEKVNNNKKLGNIGNVDTTAVNNVLRVSKHQLQQRQSHARQGQRRLNPVETTNIMNGMIDSYNKLIDKPNATITNFRTHITVQNNQFYLKNRGGNTIDSLIISKGVPKNIKEMKKNGGNYGGIIVYNEVNGNNDILRGQIYMLDSKLCQHINHTYSKQHNGGSLNGKVHGAIYYHYFHRHTGTRDKYQNKWSPVRGFSIQNGIFKFRSGVFNFDWENYRFFDQDYKELPQYEKLFIEYAIQRYWKNNKNIICEFKTFRTQDVILDVEKFMASLEKFDKSNNFDNCNDFENDKKEDITNDDNDNNDDNDDIDNELELKSQFQGKQLGGYHEMNCKLTEINALEKDLGFRKIRLAWNIITSIVDCLVMKDCDQLHKTSKISKFIVNKYMFELSTRSINHKSNCANYPMFLLIYEQEDIDDNKIIKQIQHICTKDAIKLIEQMDINFDNLTLNHRANSSDNINASTLSNNINDSLHYCLLLQHHPKSVQITLGHELSNRNSVRIGNWLKNVCDCKVDSNNIGLNDDEWNYVVSSVVCEETCEGEKKAEMEKLGNHGNDTFKWSWNYGVDKDNKSVWIPYELEAINMIENAYNSAIDETVYVTIHTTHCQDEKTKQFRTKMYQIYFEKQSKIISNRLGDENAFHNITNGRWNDAFTSYYFQQNVENNELLVAKRVNVTKQNQFSCSFKHAFDNYFE